MYSILIFHGIPAHLRVRVPCVLWVMRGTTGWISHLAAFRMSGSRGWLLKHESEVVQQGRGHRDGMEGSVSSGELRERKEESFKVLLLHSVLVYAAGSIKLITDWLVAKLLHFYVQTQLLRWNKGGLHKTPVQNTNHIHARTAWQLPPTNHTHTLISSLGQHNQPPTEVVWMALC